MQPQEPLKLAPDNFTPPSRTPWGGYRIFANYKRHLSMFDALPQPRQIGEAWEVSIDPAFPSDVLLQGTRRPLKALLAEAPIPLLGRRNAEAFGGSTPILMKLLDAAEPLSVQVHPDDSYAGLQPHESGKPECWYILDADPGAGLYLGLAPDVSRRELEQALRGGGDLTPMLNFVPVSPGEMFMIGPGTIHAIGPGVTLAEPQLVFPGKSGKTYRFWDWNRRYDPHGKPSPHGQPRELHIDHSLAVTCFDAPRGAAFVESCRSQPKPLQGDPCSPWRHTSLGALSGLQVELLEGSGLATLPHREALVAAMVLQGHTTWFPNVQATRGESLILPASLRECAVELRDARVILAWMA